MKSDTGGKRLTDADYRVKMRFGKNGKEKDLTTLHYNDTITLTGIPLEAYDYVINGKPALDWVVERQCVKTDKAAASSTTLTTGPSKLWATLGTPRSCPARDHRHPGDFKIVKALPALYIREGG